MNTSDQQITEHLYQQHLTNLKLQGKRAKTIELYAWSLRRLIEYFDRRPDELTVDDLKRYFADLIDTHSWSTVKVDRNAFHVRRLARTFRIRMATSATSSHV